MAVAKLRLGEESYKSEPQIIDRNILFAITLVHIIASFEHLLLYPRIYLGHTEHLEINSFPSSSLVHCTGLRMSTTWLVTTFLSTGSYPAAQANLLQRQ